MNNLKLTVVIGASENPERYSNRVVRMLRQRNIPVVAIGQRAGEIYPVGNELRSQPMVVYGVDGVKIQTGLPKIDSVDTVTLYLAEKKQPPYYAYILSLKPQRVIFNPGTENSAFERTLREAEIEVLEACTLTMLTVGNF